MTETTNPQRPAQVEVPAIPEQPRIGPLCVLSDDAWRTLQERGRVEFGGTIYYRSYEDYCDD